MMAMLRRFIRIPGIAAALAAFAVMAMHLGHHGDMRESLSAELLGHHASLAFALVILYQDYRFALADLFLKRVLSAVLLVAFALGAYFAVAPFVAGRLAMDPMDPRAVATLLGLWILTAVLYPWARRAVDTFVDRVVLRRVNYEDLRDALATRLAGLEDPAAVLDATVALLAPALSAGRATWSEAEPSVRLARPTWLDARHQAVSVPVQTTDAPAFALTLGMLRSGRRLLSDDLTLLEAAGTTAARRIDAIRVVRERWDRGAREREIQQLATEAELRALRAQLNPHFLFNALTTIGHLLQEAPDRALSTLLRLTALLRAVLKPTAGDLVSLGDEMDIVESYLMIEQARFEHRLRVTIDVADEIRALRLPPLLLQPLVENAVKHGISPLRAGGEITVVARIVPGVDGSRQQRLHLTVNDSGAGVTQSELARRRAGGLGLASVEQRLERQFRDAAAFAFSSVPGTGSSVQLWLPVIEPEQNGGGPLERRPDGAARRIERTITSHAGPGA